LFYPDDAQKARQLAERYLSSVEVRINATEAALPRWLGGIVPHAGWICSGAIAGQTISTIARSQATGPDVIVVFAAVHTPLPLEQATLDTFAGWTVPGATSEVSKELRSKLLEAGGRELFAADDRFHSREHAVEVELPLIQAAWPGAAMGKSPAILPVESTRNLMMTCYPRMIEILQLLGSSSFLIQPSEKDFEGPLKADIEQYLATDSIAARDRVKLFRLAWDVAGNAFGSRQVLYERFFASDPLTRARAMAAVYPKGELTERVREFLSRDDETW